MIKNILFDCAGVLTHMDFRAMMLKLSGSEVLADCFVNTLWSPVLLGSFMTEVIWILARSLLNCRNFSRILFIPTYSP